MELRFTLWLMTPRGQFLQWSEAAILGISVSKPILYFNGEGVIEVYEKVRIKRLVEIVAKEQHKSLFTGMH